ncbi:hypothetical protein M8I34_09520 [Streptomyces sp. MCA2]|uniref:hypothetical protein n=1 Tax=Streptomyces sp. MCA2 TaxID=2944805 RepID=UPI0020227E83|nr:hypothetical protein [Streptomyces sp. MCA2]MCL7491674.1 hypothetical protein [Streptomyces sp. MCA2]
MIQILEHKSRTIDPIRGLARFVHLREVAEAAEADGGVAGPRGSSSVAPRHMRS